MLFEWDPDKNTSNKKKHGISFEAAILVFADPDARSIFDEEHSDEEERWVTLGMVQSGKILLVIHTDRIKIDDKTVIRVISARKATDNESRQYTRFNKR